MALEALEAKIRELSTRRENLLDAIEGGGNIPSLAARVEKLDREIAALEQKKQEQQKILTLPAQITDVAEEASVFLERYRLEFDALPLEEQRLMLRKVIVGIRVDPIARTVDLVVARVPLVDKALTSRISTTDYSFSGGGVANSAQLASKRLCAKTKNPARKHGILWANSVAGEGFEPTTCGL